MQQKHAVKCHFLELFGELISKRNMPCYLVFLKKCVLTKVSNVDTEYMAPSKKGAGE